MECLFGFSFSFLTFKFLNKDTDLDSRRFFWHVTTMMGLLSDIYIRIFQKVLLISHLYSFVLVSYMTKKSVFIFSVILGVSTVLWHLSESAVLTDFQEIKPKYLKINATANKKSIQLLCLLSLKFCFFSLPHWEVMFKVLIFFGRKYTQEKVHLYFYIYLFNQLPRNYSHLASACYIWPDPEKSQGNTQRSSMVLKEANFICIQLEIPESWFMSWTWINPMANTAIQEFHCRGVGNGKKKPFSQLGWRR